jgi:hypothetical protein
MERYHELAELRRDWKPPVELTVSTPREVKLRGGGIAVAILAAGLFAGAIASAALLSRVASRQADESRALRETGIVIPATVTRHWRSGDKEAQRRIAYLFEYQGRMHEGSSKTPKAIWARLEVGSPIDIRIVPGRPEVNHPAEWQRDDMPAWVPPGIAALLVAVGMFLIWLIRRQIRLLSDGRPAPAVVVGHRRVQHGQQAIKYEFALLEGGMSKGSGHPSRKPLAVGSVITVVYDRDNPKRNSPYPMEMVRVVR